MRKREKGNVIELSLGENKQAKGEDRSNLLTLDKKDRKKKRRAVKWGCKNQD